MLRSMFSGVSGLRSHQTMMDVIGNNIANVNTTGYKSSQVVFQDLLSQLIGGAGAPSGGNGGTNPAQVGLGVKLGAITTNFNQGASQLTGRSTDVAIQGDGFFIANIGGQQLYTRAGAFNFDTNGSMVTPDGGIIQGWSAKPDGTIDTNQAIGNLVMPPGQVIAPSQTHSLKLGGNLPADAAVGTVIATTITTYDEQGTAVPVNFEFTKTAADTWSLQAKDASGANIGSAAVMNFTAGTGALASTTPSPITITPPGTWDAAGITIDFGTPGTADAIVQFAGQERVAALSQDGSPLGSLQSFSISKDGLVTGVFSNGRNQPLARIALASFNNPTGLEKAGGSMYRETVNSGIAKIGISGVNGRGLLAGGTLEMSNVDLAQEFTSMIVAQRGFQANSRVITASDELLQDLVNLKH